MMTLTVRIKQPQQRNRKGVCDLGLGGEVVGENIPLGRFPTWWSLRQKHLTLAQALNSWCRGSVSGE